MSNVKMLFSFLVDSVEMNVGKMSIDLNIKVVAILIKLYCSFEYECVGFMVIKNEINVIK